MPNNYIQTKNKNLFLYLEPDEEIIYQAEKSKGEFIYSLFSCAFPLIVYFIGLPLFFIDPDFPLQYRIFLLLLLITFSALIYKILKDFFYTEIYVTNQKLILSIFNKIVLIKFDQIDYIRHGITGTAAAIAPIIIHLKVKKTYKIFFFNALKLKQAIKEIFINYDDNKIVEKQNTNAAYAVACLMIFAPIWIFILFHLFKWVDKLFP